MPASLSHPAGPDLAPQQPTTRRGHRPGSGSRPGGPLARSASPQSDCPERRRQGLWRPWHDEPASAGKTGTSSHPGRPLVRWVFLPRSPPAGVVAGWTVPVPPETLWPLTNTSSRCRDDRNSHPVAATSTPARW